MMSADPEYYYDSKGSFDKDFGFGFTSFLGIAGIASKQFSNSRHLLLIKYIRFATHHDLHFRPHLSLSLSGANPSSSGTFSDWPFWRWKGFPCVLEMALLFHP